MEAELKKYFGHEQFRVGQKEMILALQDGKDVLGVLPTGAGKSLIYQLPAILSKEKIVIVISPLIALMKEQVETLVSLGVSAGYCNSSQDELVQLSMISSAVNGKLRLLYVSPERAVSQSFLSYIKKMKILFFAIDEAHCISRWGHDFRPEYRELSKLREGTNESIPIIALTATATETVKLDIVKSLGLKKPFLYNSSFYRDNLKFQIEFLETDTDKETRLLELLLHRTGRTIIYAATRNSVEEIGKLLVKNGIENSIYHAGLKEEAKLRALNSYFSGKKNVLVGTNAFGMGMDSPDVRLVVHYHSPASLEAYYQEAGRAGRDGKVSNCILFYREKDFRDRKFWTRKDRNEEGSGKLLAKMEEYILSEVCRQKFICGYFGEKIKDCKGCDICSPTKDGFAKEILAKRSQREEEKKEKSSYEFSNHEVLEILNIIKNLSGQFGKSIITAILKGSKTKEILKRKLERNSSYGIFKSIPEESIKKKIDLLVEEKKIQVLGKKYPKLASFDSIPIQRKPKSKILSSNDSKNELYKKLKNFRDYEARKRNWKKFMVFQNKVLERIASTKPKSISELVLIKGIGENKVKEFGQKIIDIMSKFEGSQ
ncbi:MAG: ATP-dependent DNA helicase RecQ [Leptospiraceae bacterium]|nr:ATP-dependent DNA helicase RecQ [Leptospiraceae bacterium]